MSQKIREIMTRDPIVLDAGASARDAARAMKARQVGDVLVSHDGALRGIVTDRDIVVRCLAEEGQEAASTPLESFCSGDPVTLGPDADADEAVALMRDKAIRRIPVVENGKPVGIVSLGDLAVHRDRESVLGRISGAPAQ